MRIVKDWSAQVFFDIWLLRKMMEAPGARAGPAHQANLGCSNSPATGYIQPLDVIIILTIMGITIRIKTKIIKVMILRALSKIKKYDYDNEYHMGDENYMNGNRWTFVLILNDGGFSDVL